MVASLKRPFKGFGSKPKPLEIVRSDQVQPMLTLEEWAKADFYGSIPMWARRDRRVEQLYRANVFCLEGDAARAEFNLSRTALLSRSASTRSRAEAIDDGFWGVSSSTVDGDPDGTVYAKPRYPWNSIKNGKIKPVKYEGRSGEPATPVLLWVTWDCGFGIARRFGLEREYEQRFEQSGANVENVDQYFWKWVESHPEIPIVICEGVKKAFALMVHNVLAVAIRGVTQWHLKGSNELHESIKRMATAERRLYICFDADTKPLAIRNGAIQQRKFGRALEAKGCKVSILGWNSNFGKGVDDVLVGQEGNSQTWLDKLIATAPTFQEWSKGQYKEYLLRVWDKLRVTGIEPERVTEGQFMPEPQPIIQSAIHIFSATQGAGKTHQIKKWVRDWVESGGFVLIVVPLINLGRNIAQRSNLPHISDFDLSKADGFQAFQLMVRHHRGCVICPDSLHRVQQFLDPDTPLLFVSDEVNQVLQGLNNGGTLKDRQGEILELFALNLQQAACNGAIVLSESGVYRRSIEQIKTLSGCRTVRLFEHKRTAQPWNCTLHVGDYSGFASKLVEAVAGGQKLIVPVSSRNQGKKLERLIHRIFGSSKSVMRIDRETNQNGAFDSFWYDPNKALSEMPELPDLLILSPSAKSGVSIEIPGFDGVWGILTCHNAAMWNQMLGRYRLPVPRQIFTKRFIPASSYEESICSVRGVNRNLNANLAGFARVFDVAVDDESQSDRVELLNLIEMAQREFYSEDLTATGIEKQFAVECLTRLLEGEGHNVTCDLIKGDRKFKEALADIQIELWREEAEQIAATSPDADMGVKEALEQLQRPDLSTESRLKAQKVLWRDEFPGVAFDDPEECYRALTEDFGRLRRGVLLQSRAANLDQFKHVEVERVEAILRGRVRLPHRLPKQFFQAALMRELGVLELLDGSPYSEQDDRVVAIKQKALHYSNEIAKWFTLFVKSSQTGIEIVNKLLRRLGLHSAQLCRKGRQGEQVRIWGIFDLCNPVRVKLLQAAYRKLDGDPSTIVQELPPSYHKALNAGESQSSGHLEQCCDELQPIEYELLDESFNEHEDDDTGWSWEVDESD